MENVAKHRPPFATLCGVWFVLVAVSVVGRLWQPAFNVTPLAGAAIAAGAVFPNPLVAVTVPLVAALGLGLSASVPGRNPALDGFGLIAFASLFPIITVLGYAQWVQWSVIRAKKSLKEGNNAI